MNGDLTRSTFDPSDEFTSVRAQQGRVMLDVDHNEQVDIQLHDTRSGRVDLVGGSGAPTDEAGFAVTLAGGQPVLGAGRYLVNGIRVSNAAQVNLGAPQPFLPVSTLPAAEGAWLAYLEVWERPLTAVEEPSIREVALGGPDTTLREQRVWQVRWHRLGVSGTGDCATGATALQNLGALYDGTLQPNLASSAASGPCIVSEAADFRGLENQLYRVEVHVGNLGPDGTPTGLTPSFKWSRDNGAVIASAVGLVSQSPLVLQVDRLGPGGAAGFEIGGTIEVKGEAEVLAGAPGILARIDDVQADTLRLTLLPGATLAQLQTTLAGKRVVVRRWDSVGAVNITNTNFLPLGHEGLEVRFDPTKRYRTGDFWLIPARTAALPGTGKQLDWPLVTGSQTEFVTRKAHGVVRHRVPLALLDRSGTGTWTPRSDCRKLFPPLTTLWTITSAGGDGQHGRSNEWLPAPLSAVVTQGHAPMPGVKVRFRVTGGGGQISAASPNAPTPVTQVDVTTDSNGIARVHMRLGPGPTKGLATAVWEPALAQTVEAVRLGPNNAPIGAPISFVAQTADNLQLHIVGGNGQQGRPGETLEVALRVRIDDGFRPLENAVVEFTVLNRAFNGQGLNEDQGGSVHASARFVSGEKWANGTRYHTVRTSTDAEGVAQVQWMLGALLDLTTQRVEARLIDKQGNVTLQKGLFLAQLALASELTWQPKVAWLASVLLGSNRNAQEAIDELARRVNILQQGTGLFNPFADLRWRNTQNVVAPLGPNTQLLGLELAAIVFRNDLVPANRNPNATTAHSGIRVYAELPYAQNPDTPLVVRLTGTVVKITDGWEWRMSSSTRSTLSKYYNIHIPVRVTVVPRWLPGGVDGDSTQLHEFGFTFTTYVIG